MDHYPVANLEEQDLEKLRSLEEQLGVILIAYSEEELSKTNSASH